MELAIVIPTLNAEQHNAWRQVLVSIASQSVALKRKIIIDSSSSDRTCAVAESFGWECRRIQRTEFNHGKTRDAIVRELALDGIDTVVFLSQDVTLSAPNTLQLLTDFLWSHPIAGCYGMQRAPHEHTLNAWQRMRCYPEKSNTRTLQDVHEQGMKAFFFSNAFSAWKTAEVIRYGGFAETDFGEDTLLAFAVLNQGGAVGYCSEAMAHHYHPNTPAFLFLRGMHIGAFHSRHPELLQKFNIKQFFSLFSVPWSIWIPLGIKCLGYGCGRLGSKLVPWGLFLLAWLLLLPAFCLYDFPQRDVAIRYAPMAEAFAHGDWQYAFHPRITPLLTMCAGTILFLTACNGYVACQIASTLFFTLGIFPLYSACKRLYGEKTAVVSALLYTLCPSFLRLGYYGTRETGGVLGIILLLNAVSLLQEPSGKLRGFLQFAVAEVLLLSCRGDVALFALVACLALFIWDLVRHYLPWRSLLVGMAILTILSPLLFYNYNAIGYPVPEVRHAAVLRKICRRVPLLKCLENPHPFMALDIQEAADE